MNKKPLFFTVFKIFGFIFLTGAIFGYIVSFKNFGNFETNNFMIGALLGTFGVAIGVFCLMLGFRPEMSKMNIKTVKYIQEENKDDLKDIVDNTADVTIDAVKKVAEVIKEDKIYCKHCGVLIDADSVFCSKCGKEQ